MTLQMGISSCCIITRCLAVIAVMLVNLLMFLCTRTAYENAMQVYGNSSEVMSELFHYFLEVTCY